MKDMLGRGEALRVDTALELLLSKLSLKNIDKETIRIEQSYGRIISRDIISKDSIPSFRRSTVDGFAVIAIDTFGLPSYLKITGEVSMGEEALITIKRGEAVRVATGGMLPGGSDSVIMLEHSQSIDIEMIEALKSVAPGENVIQIGEDVSAGEIVITTGHKLRPQDIAVLAGLGITEVEVYKMPRISLISTGDEILMPDEPIKPGFVRDMNSFTLDGLIRQEGGITVKKGIFKDDYDILLNVLSNCLDDSDMILISGGSSVGAKDHTEALISRMGSLLFHGISMKPGKPLICGIKGDIPLFGLPGHPAAVAVCFEIFVKPALRALSGRKVKSVERHNKLVAARLTRGIRSQAGREDYIRVSLEETGEVLFATPVLGKSGLITTLVKADGMVKIASEQLGLEEGVCVEVMLF